MWLRPDAWAGWILLLLGFIVVLLDRTIRSDPRLCITVWVTIAAHAIVAGVDAFLWVLPVAAPDASTFHSMATQIAAARSFEFGLDYKFYENLLAGVYAIFGSSRWAGNMFSILLYSLSCLVFVRLSRRLHGEKYLIPTVLVFGLLPSALLLASVTLREGWEILFFMLSVYAAVVAPNNARKVFWVLILIFAAVFMGFSHKALLLYSGCLVPLLLAYVGLVDTRINPISAVSVVVSGTVIVFIAIAGLVTLTESGRSLVWGTIDGNLIEEIRLYRYYLGELVNPRTAFAIEFDTSSSIAIIKSMITFYVYYLVAAPMSGLENLKDLYALLESMLRIVLLGASLLATFRSGSRSEVKTMIMLLLIYTSMTALWSIGTTNYGQAIRHHMLTNWIVILLGVPVLGQFVSRFIKR